MSKTVTLRLDDSVYQLFRSVAERKSRPLSNFIETATLKFLEDDQLMEEFEMADISSLFAAISAISNSSMS